MITKQQLIEKCEGLYFKPVDEAEWNLCVDKCKEIGVTAYAAFEKRNSLSFEIDDDGDFCRSSLNRSIPATKFLSYFEEDKMTGREICEKIVKQGDCCGVVCYRDECPLSKKYGNSCCSNHGDCVEGAKKWLKENQEQEAKMKIEEKDSDYTIQFKARTEPKTEKLSRKNYLLNRVKQIEANKKEYIARMDSEVESLQKEMTSLYCYVDEFGDYLFEKTKLYKYETKAVTEFINRMEADFESK